MSRPGDGRRAGQAAAVLRLTSASLPVVELDVRLLGVGPAAVEAALGVPVGAPTLVVVGDLDQATPAELATLTRLPVIVAARSPAGPAAARAVDVVVDDEAALEQTRRGCERAPIAATAAALLLRSPTADWWEGLVRESATYSMLQGGEEFQRWHRARGTRAGSGDAHPRVRVERHGATTEVTLTRPERHNALDTQTRDELHAALAEATTGSGPVVLLGAGPSFCSGGDLDEFGTFPDPASAHLLRLTRSVAAIIAAAADRFVVGLHGACLGAGVELPAFAGHLVVADDARVGLPELGLGLVPGAGGTVSLPARIGRHRTFELLALDGTISASAAREWGLVDELVPRTRLRSRCLEIAESLS